MSDTQDAAWTIIPYTIDALCGALALSAGAEAGVVESKDHLEYFSEYFASVRVQTILVEHRYIDRDFLDDFAAYYVRCFQSFQKACSRLHFFTEALTTEDFGAILESGTEEGRARVVDSYVGFIVVKPLPRTIIGRTCLATYGSDRGRRHFPITRKYTVNLFGICLSVNTLAFQEQDRVAAACATSALWSAFHGTGVLFQHRIPSPVEITHSATVQGLLDSRALPSAGLTTSQMANAIRQVNLEPLLISASNQWDLTGTAYAYVRGGVPALLLGSLVETGGIEEQTLGLHAVTITGYSLGLPQPTAEPGSQGFLLRASRIDKVYCHDDQVGPFARMKAGGAQIDFSLSTSWKSEATGQRGSVRFRPQHLLIPLYHKVRIPFGSVLEHVAGFDLLLRRLSTLTGSTIPQLEWDVFLSNVNSYKTEIIDDTSRPTDQRRLLLEQAMPKFIWRAVGSLPDGTRALEVLFDATGIELGQYCFRVVELDRQAGDLFRSISANHRTLLRGSSAWQIIAHLVPKV